MTTSTELMVAFLAASQGKLTPHLMKYTVDLDGDKVLARIVVLDGIGEDELEHVYDILGDLVGNLGNLVGGMDGQLADFELIKVETVQDAEATPERQWSLYRAHALELELEKRFQSPPA